MRISADRQDPAYRADHGRYRVFLDGEKVEQIVITADDQKGEVVVYAQDEQGNPRLEADGDTLIWETLRGKVEIRAD